MNVCVPGIGVDLLMRLPTYRSVDHIGCHPQPHSVVNYKAAKSVVNCNAAQPLVNCKAAQSLVNCLSTDTQGCMPTGSLFGSGSGIVFVLDVVQASKQAESESLLKRSLPAGSTDSKL